MGRWLTIKDKRALIAKAGENPGMTHAGLAEWSTKTYNLGRPLARSTVSDILRKAPQTMSPAHEDTTHTDFESVMRDATVASTGTLLPWVSQKASSRYAWLGWDIMDNLLFSFCESNETRRYTDLNPISEETLTAIMEAVTKAVKKAIGDEMSENFGLVLDGWTHGTEHYLAFYACYETSAGLQLPLLSLAPVMDEPGD
ncbi:hypothetical protein F443_00682 [Phytophthora nicotianae P1569]|uniref:Uncharacterized protein n=2 Tax=Phytophthora nicotianae TaxID=4792 RepID=V9G1P7_PHYNI|nr:hypothetical protein F443_00682 [Phytophthora nicotianae P1569]